MESSEKNLGGKLNAGDHAHHIVAGKLGSAEEARKLFDRCHIDINAATNGIYLSPDEHLKRGLHTKAAQEEVTRRIALAIKGITDWGKARQKILEQLELIAKEIASGDFRFPPS